MQKTVLACPLAKTKHSKPEIAKCVFPTMLLKNASFLRSEIVYNRASNICPSLNFSASSATLVVRLGKDVVTQEVVQRLEPATTALELCCRIAIAARR